MAASRRLGPKTCCSRKNAGSYGIFGGKCKQPLLTSKIYLSHKIGTCSLSTRSQSYINVSRTMKLTERLNVPGSRSPGSHSLPRPLSSSSTRLVLWGNDGQSQQWEGCCLGRGWLRPREQAAAEGRSPTSLGLSSPVVWRGAGLPVPTPGGSQALDARPSYTSILLSYHKKALTRSPFSKDSFPEMPRPIDPKGKGCLLCHVLSGVPTCAP